MFVWVEKLRYSKEMFKTLARVEESKMDRPENLHLGNYRRLDVEN